MANQTQTATRDIAAEPEKVWRALTHLDIRDDVFTSVSDVDAPTGPLRIGTTWTETRQILGQKVTHRVEVADLEALGLVVLTANGTGDDAGAGSTTTYKLTALHPGTRVTVTTTATPTTEETGGAAGLLRKAFTAVTATLGQHDDTPDADAERDLADLAAAAQTQAAPRA